MSDERVLVVFDTWGVRCHAALESKQAALDWLYTCHEKGFLQPKFVIDQDEKIIGEKDILALLEKRDEDRE